jgi:hypothetical protein
MAASKAAKYDALAADGFGHWLAGFIDGEGCFYMRLGDVSRKGKRTNLDIRMSVGLRADERPNHRGDPRPHGAWANQHEQSTMGRNPQVRWVVSKHSELMGLIEILDEFPPASQEAPRLRDLARCDARVPSVEAKVGRWAQPDSIPLRLSVLSLIYAQCAHTRRLRDG